MTRARPLHPIERALAAFFLLVTVASALATLSEWLRLI
jgi:hypothetical protein